jgi:putrescine transport system ATP-binding protein
MAVELDPAALESPWRGPGGAPVLGIRNVTKRFDGTLAVDDVSLDIGRGEFFSLLGGSGCGKTTLLRLVAGFERPDAGRILIDGVDVTDVPPYARPVNMMFQSYALFPHMSVAQNVAFGLRQERLPADVIRHRVAEMLNLVQLGSLAHRRPHQLSGGQRQRVALARALAKRPKLLLLDEPLAALDKKLREETEFELIKIQQQVGITFVVVTHDQEEAMTMSSRIAVMEAGHILQVGTPAEIYERPGSRSVAAFIGQVNLLEGRVLAGEDGTLLIQAEDSACRLSVHHADALSPGTSVAVAIRPERIAIQDTQGEAGGGAEPNRVRGILREVAYLGDVSIFRVELPGGRLLRVQAPNSGRVDGGTLGRDAQVTLVWEPGAGVVLVR